MGDRFNASDQAIVVVIGLVGALNKLFGVNNWAAFPPEKECTCCTTQMELIKCGSHYRTGALRELEGDVVAKLIEADCVDGLFQFLRTRGFAMGAEGAVAEVQEEFSTDWRDPTPTDNAKKVYRQMQETRRVLHLAAQHRSVWLFAAPPQDASPRRPRQRLVVYHAKVPMECRRRCRHA